GIFAQSVGGGGGSGGSVFSFTSGLGLSVGGSGDGGGNGGRVDVVNGKNIATGGSFSYGILAQSVGGGGGAGGNAGSVAATPLGGAVAIGGGGGAGGSGANVSVDHSGDIRTTGEFSRGILAQSVGGGGGAGGDANAISANAIVYFPYPSGSFSVGVGGTGGGGGASGAVSVKAAGNILAEDAFQSGGIVAQSIGGGGGAGGASKGISAGFNSVFNIAVNVGGSGGDGGVGNTAEVLTSAGRIVTRGDSSEGILAQSIGGGGGKGGAATAFTTQVPSVNYPSGQLAVAVGGMGGDGDRGGTVRVANVMTIDTHGHDSAGIVAQSIGGGGGAGGQSRAENNQLTSPSNFSITASVGVGGFGGTGNRGGTASADNKGQITTRGALSHGMLVQSIGGGGGTGGNVSASSDLAAHSSATRVGIAAGVGGMAGGGNDGGQVTVTNSARIEARGFGANGIIAQSIGGSGGSGGSAVDRVLNEPTVGIALSVGGFGGSGGRGGTVGVTNSGAIVTRGAYGLGINASSIGGGGGNGANASSEAKGEYAIGATVAGFGGAGDQGGNVSVRNNSGGNIDTSGLGAIAILAQSVGGSGGNGGVGQSASEGKELSVDLALGGFAGVGALGGAVTVTNGAILNTLGAQAHGVLAQSVGGSGGNGGAAAAAHDDDEAGIQVRLAVGGLGGSGGTGDTVDVTNNPSMIWTKGYGAFGILAQSIGGGGGSGGTAGATTGTGDVGVNLALGGFGGAGNIGGAVTVNSLGLIITEGALAHGVFAQSVGGGGGVATGTVTASKSEIAIGGGFGGLGAPGGEGGRVSLTNRGFVTTLGHGSIGVFGQSVGGGGGNGGSGMGTSAGKDVSVNLAIGGFAGNGGRAGAVDVENSGSISTRGANAHGVLAQSVGGSGGNGGAANADGADDEADVQVQLAVGGLGGTGGAGGAVGVANTASGSIQTRGYAAFGVLAQSVGGGGGTGAAAGASTGKGDTGVNLTLGGFGGAGNIGGAVRVTNAGRIGTYDDLAHGVFAQSVGGGGGVATGASSASGADMSVGGGYGGGGAAGGHGGSVTVTNSGEILTHGAGALGVFAQSVGGGGGFGGVTSTSGSGDENYMVQLGGMGGAGGNGGNVRVETSGLIHTIGERAHGVVAQSVGGGGGYAGDAKGSNANGIAIGGLGGAGGDGGNVTVIRTGDIITEGRDSIAIIAQSVGGGGGIGGAGFGRFATGDNGAGPDSIGFNSPAGDRGTGGIVTIVQNGAIGTSGDRSHGIVIQSVGGSGGLGGLSSMTLGRSGAGSQGGEGNARAIEATAQGEVVVTGASSYALFGQSATGQGNAGAVRLTAQESLFARGQDSVAVYAESSARGNKGDITVALNGDYTVGGGGTGAAVMLVGGTNNLVRNRGLTFALAKDVEIGTIGELADRFSASTITATSGNDRIENIGGRIIGNMDMGTGLNRFVNDARSSYIGLRTVNLGAAGHFADAGLTSNRGIGELGTVDVTGSYAQSATGRYVVDIDLDSQSTDRLTISGTGAFAGRAPLNFLSIDKLFDRYVIASAADGMTNAGFEPSFRPTVGFHFRTAVENGTDLVLHADKPLFSDLARLPGVGIMNGTSRSMAGYFDAVEGAASPANPMARLINMMRFLPDERTFGDTLVRLTPHYAVHTAEILNRTTDIGLDAARGCGAGARVGNMLGNCIWLEAVPNTEYRYDAGPGHTTRQDSFQTYSGGFQVQVANNWALGLSLARSNFSSSIGWRDERLSAQAGDSWHGYATVKYGKGRLFADAVFSFGNSRFSGDRDTRVDRVASTPGETLEGTYLPDILLPGIGDRVTYTQKGRQYGISARVGYMFEDGAFYYQPAIQVDGRWIRMETEESGSLAAMRFRPHTSFAISATPQFEAGAKFHMGGGNWLRPYVSGGVTFSNANWTMKGGFAAAEGLVDAPVLTLRERTAFPLTRVSAGVAITSTTGIDISVGYSGSFGGDSRQNGWVGRASFRF
ncbi:MAG: hypothetical protein AB7E60_01350, partial [Sphingobium sp.]